MRKTAVRVPGDDGWEDQRSRSGQRHGDRRGAYRPAAVRRDGNEARLTLDNELRAAESETLEVAWKW